MKIALFGGTFDPVHRGHLAVARAAAERFDLDLIHFVPADVPPHKLERPLTAFDHRFAMLALATAGDRRFVPSLLEANSGQPNYSIVTVRRLKQSLKRSDQLYFLIGMDAFKEIGTWRQPVDLLAECEFIVASRPGSSLVDVGRALPEAIRPSETVLRAFRKQPAGGAIVLPGATIHLLSDVHERVSSTQIRSAANKNIRQLERLVPKPVAEYIKKERLYVPVVQTQPEPRSKVLSFQRARHQQMRNRHS